MKIKNITQEKYYEEFIEIFKSIGEEKKCMLGETLSSFEYLTGKVFLIKEGNARLISKIDNKPTSVAKLSKGDFIGIAPLLSGKPIEEVIASKNLVVYCIKDQEFLELYKTRSSIRNF